MLIKLLNFAYNQAWETGEYTAMCLDEFPDDPNEFIEKINHFMQHEMWGCHKIGRGVTADIKELCVVQYKDFDPYRKTNDYVGCRGFVELVDFDKVGNFRQATEEELLRCERYHIAEKIEKKRKGEKKSVKKVKEA